jgi:hypothetical protein
VRSAPLLPLGELAAGGGAPLPLPLGTTLERDDTTEDAVPPLTALPPAEMLPPTALSLGLPAVAPGPESAIPPLPNCSVWGPVPSGVGPEGRFVSGRIVPPVASGGTPPGTEPVACVVTIMVPSDSGITTVAWPIVTLLSAAQGT